MPERGRAPSRPRKCYAKVALKCCLTCVQCAVHFTWRAGKPAKSIQGVTAVVVGYGCTGWSGRGPSGRAASIPAAIATALCVAVTAWLIAGCGAGVSPGDSLDTPAGSGVTLDRASAPGGFSVFEEPGMAGDGLGQAKLALSVEDSPGGVTVVVEAQDARSLKAVLAGVRYDAGRWHPESVEFTQSLGDGNRLQVTGDREQVGGASAPPDGGGTEVPPTLATDNRQLATAPVAAASRPPGARPEVDVLSLAVLTERGVVHLAQALAGYATQPGLTAERAVVARVRFSPGAFRAAKTASSPPVDGRSLAGLNWDCGPGTLAWHYASKGDGDQNGEVNLADIIPLAQRFGEFYQSTASLDTLGRPMSTYGCQLYWNIDGDENYEINLADLTFIARDFRASALGGYDVFRSSDPADCPVTPDGPNGSGAVLVAHVPFEAAFPSDAYPFDTEDPLYRGKRFKAAVTATSSDVFWVRPVDQQGQRGTPSMLAFANYLAPPMGASNQQDLYWAGDTQTLSWYLYDCGDYDQNGVVAYSDLGTLNRFLFQTSEGPPEGSVLTVVDGDGNGYINLADIQPIGGHYYTALTGYNVYGSPDLADYEACADGPSVISPIGHVEFSAAHGDPTVDRLSFSFHLDSPQPAMYYWVRPELWGQEGVESQVLQLAAL